MKWVYVFLALALLFLGAAIAHAALAWKSRAQRRRWIKIAGAYLGLTAIMLILGSLMETARRRRSFANDLSPALDDPFLGTTDSLRTVLSM